MNLPAANGLGTKKIIIKNCRPNLHLFFLVKIEFALKLSIGFSTTAYRAAMQTTNFLTDVSHFACSDKNGNRFLRDNLCCNKLRVDNHS